MLAKESLYTVEDIYKLPDKKRAELIDGEIYMMAPPSATHQRISGFLHWMITEERKADVKCLQRHLRYF